MWKRHRLALMLLSSALVAGCSVELGDDVADDASRDPALTLEKRWSAETGGWNKAVAFHPDGDVVALTARRAFVLARDDGALLEQAAVCSVVEDGAFVLADGRLALICDDGVELLRLPGGTTERVVSSEQAVSAGHVAAGMLALGSGSRVDLYDSTRWQVLESFEVGHPVNDVAISPDGRYVAVATEANLQLVERGGTGRALHDERSRVVAFSADNSALFGAARGFDGFIFDVAGGEKRATMKTGSWITAARFVETDIVLATGSNGLEAYGPAGGRAFERLDDAPAVGVAVEAGRACSGDRDGTIRCWSAAALEPSRYEPAVAANELESGGEDDQLEEGTTGSALRLSISDFSASSGASSEKLFEGTLTSISGDTLVQSGSGALPPVGTVGSLSKRVTKELGTTTLPTWLRIAQVEVIESAGDTVTLRVLEETSVVHLNGKKVDHFTRGAKTRVVW